jgi:hypothetical protein
VDAPLAALLELEVLDGVGDVDLAAIDADRRERLVEFAPGGTDERAPRAILAVAGRLADEHHARVLRALSEDGLRRSAPQVTAVTVIRGAAQRLE